MTGICRIAVVGPSGSGKTTLARALAGRLHLRCVEIDALQWAPDWTPVGEATLRASVEAALASGRWVADGNYRRLHDLTLERAQFLVWLDYSLPRTVWQLLRRTFRRAARRELLWNGNRETFARAFFSRDSILLWLLRSHSHHRRQYLALLGAGAYPDLEIVRLRSPAATRAWLAALPTADG